MATDHTGWRQKLANRRALLDRQDALNALDLDDAAPPQRLPRKAVREAELEAAAEVHRHFVEAAWARQLAVSGTVETLDINECPCLSCRERASEWARVNRLREERVEQEVRQARKDAAAGFAPKLEAWEIDW